MRRIAAILVLLAAAPAGAEVYGGSNFGSFVYPSHGCGQAPLLPQQPADMTSVRDVEAYNRQVDAYNTRIASFTDCVDAYVERARNDIRRIQEKADGAIDELRHRGRRIR